MTRRPQTDSYDEVLRAAGAYRDRFGEAPRVWQFVCDPGFVAALDAAVKDGHPVTAASLAITLGVTLPPDDYEI